mgnify:CR=1 FL=1
MTILKPLHGDEPFLYENLRTFCDQDYPHFQIVFGTLLLHDPALQAVHRLQREFPACDIAIVSQSAASGGRNPKVVNLQRMEHAAKHDLLVIADSDMRVGRDYLESLAEAFQNERTGAATCLYGALGVDGLPSLIGAMHVNDQFAPSVLVALALEPLRYCFGATMAVRRATLNRIGGLAALAANLGDDYLLGKLVSDAGERVALCRHLPHTIVADCDLRDVWSRELRWARTIRSARPLGYAGSILTHPLMLAACNALLRRSFASGVILGAALALRVALHAEATKTFAARRRVTPWLIPVRDASAAALWIGGLFGSRVRWRESEFQLRGAAMRPTSDGSSPSERRSGQTPLQ